MQRVTAVLVWTLLSVCVCVCEANIRSLSLFLRGKLCDLPFFSESLSSSILSSLFSAAMTTAARCSKMDPLAHLQKRQQKAVSRFHLSLVCPVAVVTEDSAAVEQEVGENLLTPTFLAAAQWAEAQTWLLA